MCREKTGNTSTVNFDGTHSTIAEIVYINIHTFMYGVHISKYLHSTLMLNRKKYRTLNGSGKSWCWRLSFTQKTRVASCQA